MIFELFELFEFRTLWISNSLKFELFEVRTLWSSNSMKFELFEFWTLWILNCCFMIYILNSLNVELCTIYHCTFTFIYWSEEWFGWVVKFELNEFFQIISIVTVFLHVCTKMVQHFKHNIAFVAIYLKNGIIAEVMEEPFENGYFEWQKRATKWWRL